jgi:transposase
MAIFSFLLPARRRNYICPIIGIIAIEIAISELCRREGLAVSLYYKWSKAFLDAGKNGLTRATLRDATSEEVTHLKTENNDLKKAVAELTLDVIRYKKSLGM